MAWTFIRTHAMTAAAVIIFSITGSGCSAAEPPAPVIAFPQSFSDLAEKVKPAVVNISSTTTVTVPGNPFNHYFGPNGKQDRYGGFFRKYFGELPDRKIKQQSLGSGVIIDASGLIVTNFHVVNRADDIRVKLSDGREMKATVVGRDEKTDLALIRITESSGVLPILPLGDSDPVRVGDWVLAVGNPFGLEQTVTQGIISATARVIGSGPYDDFLQTDAAINPGNSGGPLLNMRGEVIGITTAIVTGGQGIGFAMPSNLVKSVTKQLKEKGRVVRGWIGASIQSVTSELAHSFGLSNPHGALVSEVTPGGPSATAGIRSGDIVLMFDGNEIHAANDLPRFVAETSIGKAVTVQLLREAKKISVTVTVVETKPEPVPEQPVHAETSRLGILVDDIGPEVKAEYGLVEDTGVAIVEVEPGSSAELAGMRAGDIIREINRKKIRNSADLQTVMSRKESRKSLLLLLKRGNRSFYITLSD